MKRRLNFTETQQSSQHPQQQQQQQSSTNNAATKDKTLLEDTVTRRPIILSSSSHKYNKKSLAKVTTPASNECVTSVRCDLDPKHHSIQLSLNIDNKSICDNDNNIGTLNNVDDRRVAHQPQSDTTNRRHISKEFAQITPLTAVRTSCYFGIKCFRNPKHRIEFAHPGDTDYKRPYFPPAPPGSPACPYGADCYLRNLQHFIQMSHPSSNSNTAVGFFAQTEQDASAEAIDDDGNGASAPKRRRKVRVFTTEVQEWNDGDVDEDDGDLFLNDVNSDEYDSSSEEGEEEAEEDAYEDLFGGTAAP